MRLLGLSLLLFSAFLRQGMAGDPALRATNDALFSSFVPVEELKTDQRLEQILVTTRDQIWQATAGVPEVKQLLLAFQDLRPTEHVCGTATYLDPVQGVFSALTPAQRQRVLFLLQICESNDARRFAMNARNFYVNAVYGALQEGLAGINLNVYAPARFTKEHQLTVPASRLRYDPTRREIIRNDGPIDYLIVGSGPAGSILAHELRRHGKRVLLVERGPLVVPGSMDTREVSGLIDKRMTSGGSVLVQNGMAVGGGTTVNIDLCFAPTGADVLRKIDSWRRDGRIGRSDFTQPQLKAAYEWVKAAMATRVVSEGEINANNRVLWDGALRAGLHPKLYDLNTYAPGRSPYPTTDKRSAETQLLIPALKDTENPLSLLPSAEVRRVLFEDDGDTKKAIGVEVLMRKPLDGAGIAENLNGLAIPADTIIQIHAKTVILCAGALGSPAILLRSGVQNDQIGRGVVLHVSMPIIGRFDKTIDAFRGTRASVYVDDNLIRDGYALECMSAEPVYAALMSPGPPLHVLDVVKSYRFLAGFGVMLIDTPSTANRVTVDSQGEPHIAYTLSESDKIRFRRGIAKAIQVMFLGGAKQVYLPTTENIVGNNPSDGSELKPTIIRSTVNLEEAVGRLQFVPNRTLLTSAHMQATNKMGRDPSTSVVSTDFHVWGTEKLYVVDASVFPTSIGANPMQSVYTFAKIFADRADAVN
jgi:choline dehydrogenase-like flavoprotein